MKYNFTSESSRFTPNWYPNYIKAVELYNSENESNDQNIINLIVSAYQEGLNIFSNRSSFLKSSHILAKLYFKYKNYKQAENNLLLIREIEDSSVKTPNWVSLYSIITYYKLNLVSVLLKPKTFFNEIDNLKLTNNEEKIQIKSIIEDLSNNIHEFKLQNHDFNFEIFNNYFTNWKNNNSDLFNQEIKKEASTIEEIEFEESSDNTEIITQLLERINNLELENKKLRNELELFTKKKEVLIENQIVTEIKSYKRSRQLLIITDKTLSKEVIIGICKNYGFDKKNITIHDEYGRLPFNIESIRYNSPYDGIIFGPVPHSAPGKGNYSSLIEMVKNEEGYPHVEESKTMSGELKMTKESLKNALNRLNAYLEAIN